jgi:hypothetical protein
MNEPPEVRMTYTEFLEQKRVWQESGRELAREELIDHYYQDQGIAPDGELRPLVSKLLKRVEQAESGRESARKLIAEARQEAYEDAAQHWPVGELGDLPDFLCSCGVHLLGKSQEARLEAWKLHIRSLDSRAALGASATDSASATGGGEQYENSLLEVGQSDVALAHSAFKHAAGAAAMSDRCSICKSKSHGTQAHRAADMVSERIEKRANSTQAGAAAQAKGNDLRYCGKCNMRRYFKDGKCEMCGERVQAAKEPGPVDSEHRCFSDGYMIDGRPHCQVCGAEINNVPAPGPASSESLREKLRKMSEYLKSRAWNDSGLCEDPDLDEMADELAALASAPSPAQPGDDPYTKGFQIGWAAHKASAQSSDQRAGEGSAK